MTIEPTSRPLHWRISVVVVSNPMVPEGRVDAVRAVPATTTPEQHPACAATLAYYRACEAIRRGVRWGIANISVILESSDDEREWQEDKRNGYSLVDRDDAMRILDEMLTA